MPGTLINLVGWIWIAWIISWMLAAGWSTTATTRGSTADRRRYTLPTWVGAIMVFARFHSSGALFRPIYAEPMALGWGAVVLVLVGLAWAWWARIHLGRLWSATVTLKPDHAVIRSGPYRFTRHPIYSGLLLSLLATAVLRDSWLAVAGWVVLVVAFVIKYQQEETLLSTTLGDAYAAYRAEVPALVPFVGWHRSPSTLVR